MLCTRTRKIVLIYCPMYCPFRLSCTARLSLAYQPCLFFTILVSLFHSFSCLSAAAAAPGDNTRVSAHLVSLVFTLLNRLCDLRSAVPAIVMLRFRHTISGRQSGHSYQVSLQNQRLCRRIAQHASIEQAG